MPIPTAKIRHVWRDVPSKANPNQTVEVLAIQQWMDADGSESQEINDAGGIWTDVPISLTEDPGQWQPPGQMRQANLDLESNGQGKVK